MFFIERLLHLSPDHGSGLTELAIVMVVTSALLLAKAATMFALRRGSRWSPLPGADG